MKKLTAKDMEELNRKLIKDKTEERFTEVAGKRYQILSRVCDRDNNMATVAEGFTTRKAARDFAESTKVFWFISDYVVRV